MKFKTEGLVIREQTIGESDRLVWVLTRDEGVLRAFARRAKKLQDGKNAATGLLCYSRFTVYRGKEADNISEAFPVESFFGLREDLDRLALAQYFCELAFLMVPAGVESGEILRLLLNALHFLSSGERPAALLKPLVELRLMSLAGFMPNLLGCEVCGKYEGEEMRFFAGRGTLLCRKHAPAGEAGLRLSPGALYAMRYIVFSPLEKLFSFQLAEPSLAQLSRAAEEYTLAVLQHKPGTLSFYHSLSSPPEPAK